MRDFVAEAREILKDNRRAGYTVPAKDLYPFQWNWDSGFVSLGLSTYSLDEALEEIATMFKGQWDNGMLPHILFHSMNEKTYFPNYDFWNSAVNPSAREYPPSSGITQPAVFGFVLEAILERFPDDQKVIEFVRSYLPKIIDYHRYLYRTRDPKSEGLMYIFHPWESGRDNSPLWDIAMSRIDIEPGSLPQYSRRDTSIADASERPTNDQYDIYVYLLEYGKKCQYDGLKIAESCPFLIQDTLMNAILIRSNEALIKLGERLGIDTGEVKEWQVQSKLGFEKLWNSEASFYQAFDLQSSEHIPYKEIGGFSPLFGFDLSEQRRDILCDALTQMSADGFFLCPSFDPDHELFDSKRYWRGPVWPQMNWLLYHGLQRHGKKQLANLVKKDLISLIEHYGFYEYFEAEKDKMSDLEKGYGGGHFSWTAACYLDLKNNQ